MLAKVLSVTTMGLDTLTVEVEVNAARGKPEIHIVGLPTKAVQESQHRVRSALQNCGVHFPAKRLTINLAPADTSKEGPVFDLPIALGILHAFEEISLDPQNDTLFIGELSLDGSIRKVKGALPSVLHAKQLGFEHFVIPQENADEVAIISGISIHPVHHIMQLVEHYQTRSALPLLEHTAFSDSEPQDFLLDFSDIHGQETAKRVLEIAAAGSHNVLMNGSPGSGKSMLAKAFISILPPLSESEAIEVTNIYSISGLTQHGLIRHRPFRAPHHSTSQVGLIGGGVKLKPGEISLAHRGVLFLDEFPEFSQHSLESLRQPLEDRIIRISRASGTAEYPAQFMLIAAANPCPCGHRLSKKTKCSCNTLQVERYRKKISGPILDRIDLHIHVHEVEVEKLATWKKGNIETSSQIRQRVHQARKKQSLRYHDTPFLCNSELTSQAAKKFCQTEPAALGLLKQGVERFHLSARGYFKVLKVAQTIADLSDSPLISAEHVAEALQYRQQRE